MTPNFGTLVRPVALTSRRRKEKEFSYFDNHDRRMRFNNSQDPIYYIFDCIENRPIKTLAKEFVKDSIFDVMNFVSKVVNQ